MPEWAIALVAAIVGALVGGFANAYGAQLVERRAEDQRIRVELLKTLLANLGSERADLYLSGAYRYQLDEALTALEGTMTALSVDEWNLGGDLALAWKTAVLDQPYTTEFQEGRLVSEEACAAIDDACRALRAELERRLHVGLRRKPWATSSARADGARD